RGLARAQLARAARPKSCRNRLRAWRVSHRMPRAPSTHRAHPAGGFPGRTAVALTSIVRAATKTHGHREIMNETVRRTSGAASATTLVAIAILGLVLAASMGKFAGGAHVGLLHVPDAPILLVSDGRENFGRYYAEILQTEGFAAFAVAD